MKLSADEQKEKQLENYKMLSAISGKNVETLMGEETKSNYPEKDCMIKLLYLKNLIYPISSNELYKTLKSQGYDKNNSTFRVMLNQYQKYNYVRKVNNKKPFLYQITELGNQHIKNPYLAREEGIRRYHEFQNQKLKELIENDPEQFKAIYESIFGIQNSVINTVVSNSGSQYSPNDYGGEIIKEVESKIYDHEFFKNADESKLKSLVDGILDPSISREEREELLLDAFQEAVKAYKGSMTLQQRNYETTKPVGERKYYSILANSINSKVTKGLYEALPFRFIQVGNQIRLKSIPEAGTYKNNHDATVLDFDYVNRTYFNNSMTIKINNNGKELEFYYTGGYRKDMITTMSYPDYGNAKKKTNPTLRIVK